MMVALMKNRSRQGAGAPRCAFLIFFVGFLSIKPVVIFAQDENQYQSDAVSASISQGEIIDLGSIYVEDTFVINGEMPDRPTAFTTIIDPGEMARQSISISDVLESVSGVSIRSFGGLGSLSTVSIRGIGSENVLVLLDGVPLNPAGGTVDLSDISLESLDRVEISRGGESAYLGGGASGGVIRLISVQPKDGEAGFSARISAGSFDTVDAAFTWRPPNTVIHVETSGSRSDFSFLNNNGTDFDSSDDFIDTRDNNEFGSFDSRISRTWNKSESQAFTLSGEWFRSNKGIPGIITFPSSNASQTDSRTFFDAIYSDDDFRDGQLSLSMAWLRQSRNFSDPLGESTGVPLFSSWIHDRYDLKTEWCGPGFDADDVLTSTVSLTREMLDSSDFGSTDRTNLGVSLSDEYYFSCGAISSAAVRGDLIDGDLTVSTRGGVKYPLAENWDARCNLGLDFRPPSFEELYRNEGLVVGNPDLLPERTLNFDLGITHTSSHLRLEAAYFNLQTRDLIDYLLVSGFRWKPFNIGRVRSSGFEMSSHFIISPEWEFQANYTRTNAVDTSGDPSRQGKRMVGQPSSDIYSELRFRCSPWDAFATWEYRGSSPLTPSNSRMLPSYNVSGMGVGYDLSSDQSLTFEIRNLFDESISDVRGFPLPGRSIFLTWKGEW
jgi:vitamin B12 transporter